ncbi:MAG: DUF2203 domain-containing protein [Armatimonadetes bacterium]|nr:DUF2203 domain-containing protein [Armatimonadota bacterium]MDE2207712.1 DUF2203 domain-containing protein [Armatimonadota bacterium]
MEHKRFTVQEARAELPWLRIQIERVQELAGRLSQNELQAIAQQKLAASNGHGLQRNSGAAELAELHEIARAIQNRGIQVKDLVRGLVDFPHLRAGREVLLCWLYGEDDITWWHTEDDGFNGRQPL